MNFLVIRCESRRFPVRSQRLIITAEFLQTDREVVLRLGFRFDRQRFSVYGNGILVTAQVVQGHADVRAKSRYVRSQCLRLQKCGERLIRAVTQHSKVPVLKHYKGVCHVYVDRAADLDMAISIALNAKCQRPGVCNAMETLLVHEAVAEAFLPRVGEALVAKGVEIRGDAHTCRLIPQAGPAKESDWSEEYLDLILAVRVVGDLAAAIAHIERYGTQHSDVIVTADDDGAERFTHEVDSATVYVNASSRFTDGYEFGLGAEIGISTGKLHARGPCGLEELTTYKYIIQGTGQIRQ